MIQVNYQPMRESKSGRQGADVVVRANFLSWRHPVSGHIHKSLKFRSENLAHLLPEVRQEWVARQELEFAGRLNPLGGEPARQTRSSSSLAARAATSGGLLERAARGAGPDERRVHHLQSLHG